MLVVDGGYSGPDPAALCWQDFEISALHARIMSKLRASVRETSALRYSSQIRFNNSLGRCVSHQAGRVMDIQFVHDLLAVFFNRFDA